AALAGTPYGPPANPGLRSFPTRRSSDLSTFKPFVFGAALESGRWTPASLVVDAPETFRDPWTGKDWKPQNYERNRFDGTMTLRRSEEHTSELQSRENLVCRLLLETKKDE